MSHPITRTSLSTGTGNFTFVEDVSDILQVNDIFESYIDLDTADPEQWEFSINSVYLGAGVFSRGDVLSSSNDDGSPVDFSEGTKTIDINLIPTEIIRNTTGVVITNGSVQSTAFTSDTSTSNTLNANTVTANNVNFGTYSPLAAEVVTGYITILDALGNPRKLAVVA